MTDENKLADKEVTLYSNLYFEKLTKLVKFCADDRKEKSEHSISDLKHCGEISINQNESDSKLKIKSCVVLVEYFRQFDQNQFNKNELANEHKQNYQKIFCYLSYLSKTAKDCGLVKEFFGLQGSLVGDDKKLFNQDKAREINSECGKASNSTDKQSAPTPQILHNGEDSSENNLFLNDTLHIDEQTQDNLKQDNSQPIADIKITNKKIDNQDIAVEKGIKLNEEEIVGKVENIPVSKNDDKKITSTDSDKNHSYNYFDAFCYYLNTLGIPSNFCPENLNQY